MRYGKNFTRLEEIVKRTNRGLESSGITMMGIVTGEMLRLSLIRKEIGFYYCHEIMDGLTAEGIPLGESLVLLTECPPENLYQLENPIEYTSFLIPEVGDEEF